MIRKLLAAAIYVIAALMAAAVAPFAGLAWVIWVIIGALKHRIWRWRVSRRMGMRL